jgi:hypothetical protein
MDILVFLLFYSLIGFIYYLGNSDFELYIEDALDKLAYHWNSLFGNGESSSFCFTWFFIFMYVPLSIGYILYYVLGWVFIWGLNKLRRN